MKNKDSVVGYLGVYIDRQKDSTVHLTQKGLAHCIVQAMHLNDKIVDAVDTPCTKFLPLDEFGSPAHGEFSYPSVVRLLNYLQENSQSDITLTTSQYAHYVHNPKRLHKLALSCIGQYLKGTLDKGLIFKPVDAESLQIDVYVDVVFACGWGTELGTNLDSIKSRTGYIIKIANCPVIWVLKLQSTVATSTMKSEYTAMSMAMRSVIPLLAVIVSVSGGLKYTQHKLLTFKATVHKDNQGAIIFANLEDG